MERLTTSVLKSALIHVCDLIVESEPMLTELDSIIGDGDHGYGMRDGFSELRTMLTNQEFESIYELLRNSGLELVKTMGGASGVIFGTLFIGGLNMAANKSEFEASDVVKFFDESAKSISRRGRTHAGDKTMLDALLPAVEAMYETLAISNRVSDVFSAAYDGALAGVEKTKTMVPRLGRSKNFRDMALGLPDPGAVSTSIIFKGLYEGISVENRK
ncbi:MAG: dihydroxyacetone kinase subunit L [Negativicutes bacterium]|nr:dihydroxyacetone kinase subunit L [Negativicutes bacterium]NCU29972.1 dihydroxyacetone kinase subunit L [Candidatus Saccharibacteria bacterium]